MEIGPLRFQQRQVLGTVVFIPNCGISHRERSCIMAAYLKSAEGEEGRKAIWLYPDLEGWVRGGHPSVHTLLSWYQNIG